MSKFMIFLWLLVYPVWQHLLVYLIRECTLRRKLYSVGAPGFGQGANLCSLAC